MTDSDISKIEKEIAKVVKKYGIKSAVFGGNTDDNFIGFAVTGDDMVEIKQFWEYALNAGRLFQHMREQTRSILNKYEKCWK